MVLKSMKQHDQVHTDLQLLHQINEEKKKIKGELKEGYRSSYAPLVTPSDGDVVKQVLAAVHTIKTMKPTMLVLIGIGGSNMGTLALVQALNGSLYNENSSSIQFYCADTIDNDFDSALLMRTERELTSGGRVIICLVTKSGTTTESLVNGSLFLEVLKKYKPEDYYKYVVTITDGDSALAVVAREKKYTLLTIPKNVGGRYSVFTAVGLFPLALLGIDIMSFCSGAQHMLTLSLNEEIDGAVHSALMLYTHYQEGYTAHNLFVFSPDLLMLANWYKQLIGESLGKKNDLKGNLVEVGLTPLVSVGTTDLHSVTQLYLAGPHTTFTTFIGFENENNSLLVPHNELSAIVPGLATKSIAFIKQAIFKGVIEAYADEKRPFNVTILEEKNSANLGRFMMMKMLETLYLAKLWNINPFDQPAVELYKKRAHALMNTDSL